MNLFHILPLSVPLHDQTKNWTEEILQLDKTTQGDYRADVGDTVLRRLSIDKH